jgi:hypothetical protein
MIRIDRGPEPTVLTANGARWRTEYQSWRAAPVRQGAEPRRYQSPAIKNALSMATHEKCVYCESQVSATYWGDVEHILPRAARPDLVVEWVNLTYVCAVCNNRKSDYYEPTLPIIDPHAEEPGDHVTFLWSHCLPTLGSRRGRVTISTVDLNRNSLHDRRRDRLRALSEIIDSWAILEEDDPVTAQTFKREALKFVESDSEYSAACRAFLKLRTDWL